MGRSHTLRHRAQRWWTGPPRQNPRAGQKNNGGWRLTNGSRRVTESNLLADTVARCARTIHDGVSALTCLQQRPPLQRSPWFRKKNPSRESPTALSEPSTGTAMFIRERFRWSLYTHRALPSIDHWGTASNRTTTDHIPPSRHPPNPPPGNIGIVSHLTERYGGNGE